MGSIGFSIGIKKATQIPDKNVGLEIWKLLKGTLEKEMNIKLSSHIYKDERSAAEWVFYEYLDDFDVNDELIIDNDSIMFFFPDYAGTCNYNAAIVCHWFMIAASLKSTAIKKIIKDNGFEMLPLPSLQEILEPKDKLFVSIDQHYYCIHINENEAPEIWSDNGQLDISRLKDYEQAEIDLVIRTRRCGCHLCRSFDKDFNSSSSMTKDEALAKMNSWIEQNFGKKIVSSEIYYSQKLPWFGMLHQCYMIRYILEDGFEGLGITGPFTFSFKDIPFDKIGPRKEERKYLFANCAAAQFLYDTLQKDFPDVINGTASIEIFRHINFNTRISENHELMEFGPVASFGWSPFRLKNLDHKVWQQYRFLMKKR